MLTKGIKYNYLKEKYYYVNDGRVCVYYNDSGLIIVKQGHRPFFISPDGEFELLE